MKYLKLTQIETETTNRPTGLKKGKKSGKKKRRKSRKKRRGRRKQQLIQEPTTESCINFEAIFGSKAILAQIVLGG